MIVTAAFACTLALGSFASPSEPPVTVTVDAGSGTYAITDASLGWTLSGSVGSRLYGLHFGQGHDRVGAYKETTFRWTSGVPLTATVKSYFDRHTVLFRLHYCGALTGPGLAFPDFSTMPAGLHPFSFRDQSFAAPTFSLTQSCSPWLMFDGLARSLIVSPASNFMVAAMSGDGVSRIASGLDRRLRRVPGGLDQDTILVFAGGINQAWDTWGASLRKLYARSDNWCAKDPVVTRFGYWTDNGADYYYDYDLDKGYEGTLKAVVDRYRLEGVHVGYVQLDSWWYDKTTDDPAGKPAGTVKNKRLPQGAWNRFGGLWEYRADKDLFPDGLAAFQAGIGVPLAVHNRWMDRKSPYHDRYRISGVAAVDPAWWNDVAAYLASGRVECYEQDWLDTVFSNSPEMSREVGIGDAFTDTMARACADRGLAMQYCMASPRFFLQGLKYPNLTTIRTSGDRFEPGKWSDFLFVSRLADCVGIRPWCDVFKSREMGNMILGALSAGPVGTGDRIGKENPANVLRAARPDGLLVKPDRPALPSDRSYIERDGPVIAETYTEAGGSKTLYMFAFPRPHGTRDAAFRLSEFGVSGRFYVFEQAADAGRFVDAGEALRYEIGPSGYLFLEAAPVGPSGIALLGDLGKIVPTGRQRISAISDRSDGVRVRVSLASGEASVVLSGVSPKPPKVAADHGSARLASYDRTTGRFSVQVTPAAGATQVPVTLSVR